MKSSIGPSRKTCILDGEEVIIDGYRHQIEDIKELEYEVGPRIFAIFMLFPLTCYLLFIFYSSLPDLERSSLFTIIVWGFLLFGFVFGSMSIFWYYLIQSFRYRGKWRLNFTRKLFIEKCDDTCLEDKLGELSKIVYQQTTRVQCPFCHKINPVYRCGNYICSQCNVEFDFDGSSDLKIVKKNTTFVDKLGSVCLITFFLLIWPIYYFNNNLKKLLNVDPMLFVFALLVFGFGLSIIGDYKIGVLNIRSAKIYRQDTPKFFLFCLVMQVLIEIMIAYFWISLCFS